MSKLRMNKNAIYSLFLTGTIALNVVGCTREIRNNHKKTEKAIQAEETIKEYKYINKYGREIDLSEMNNHAYILTNDDGRYTLCNGANIYFKGEWNINGEIVNDRALIVRVISSNGKYTFVELPTGEKGYVDSGYLVKCANVNTDNYIYYEDGIDSALVSDAYIYNDNGMYIGYLHSGETCKIMASNYEYSYITLSDGTCGYVLDKVLTGNYNDVNGMAFISYGTRLYYDKQLSKLYRITDNEAIYVEYISNKYAAIYDTESNGIVYTDSRVIRDDFVLVDLNDQKIDCYLDYQLAGSWGTRSGKDSTPTHTGAFDIDEKIADWEFTTYPGSYAKYWIPISNETQEGIHDLVGDDEQNYGNEAYHTHGSHGCIRVPAEASKFVYDNYEVGDMVLVRKK